MYKERETVIKELRELFDVENNLAVGTTEHGGQFFISKKQLERGEVIARLQQYFNGVGVQGGYVQVDPLTFVFTSFAVKEGTPA